LVEIVLPSPRPHTPKKKAAKFYRKPVLDPLPPQTYCTHLLPPSKNLFFYQRFFLELQLLLQQMRQLHHSQATEDLGCDKTMWRGNMSDLSPSSEVVSCCHCPSCPQTCCRWSATAAEGLLRAMLCKKLWSQLVPMPVQSDNPVLLLCNPAALRLPVNNCYSKSSL
jgi:hypothetical protein